MALTSHVFMETDNRCFDINPVFGNTRKVLSSGYFFFFNLCGGTLGNAATTGLLYYPRMIGDGDCGEKLVE
jgi:hypothetical protein